MKYFSLTLLTSNNILSIFNSSSYLILILDSSVGKESTCNARDPGLIPGEGIDCPLQYSWASLVAQLVKNPPAMEETWVQSLGWEDPLEEGKAMTLIF